LKKTGWTEQWLGFSGPLAKQFLSNGFFNPKHPIVQKCKRTTIPGYFDSLFKLFNHDPFGYQSLSSGICILLIVELFNIQQSSDNEDSLNTMVSRTKHLTYKQINETIDLEHIASEFGVSYYRFRADFIKQT